MEHFLLENGSWFKMEKIEDGPELININKTLNKIDENMKYKIQK